MGKRLLTPQKRRACAALHAGLDEVAACAQAEYTRPDTAAAKLFQRNADGEFVDMAVREEMARLMGKREQDEEPEGVDLMTLPKSVLAQMAKDKNSSDTARVQAAKALDAIQERERLEALANDKGADEFAAADAMRQMLRMPRLSREQHEAWKASLAT